MHIQDYYLEERERNEEVNLPPPRHLAYIESLSLNDKELFAKHGEDCAYKKSCRIILPDPSKEDERFIEFENFKNNEYVGLVLYAETDALLESRH